MTLGAVILADDLSGAGDCGIQAVRRGLRTTVSLMRAAPRADVDVLAIDLDTRAETEATAFDRTRDAARVARDTPVLYLKLDSLLRGHLGAAIDGALDATQAEIALVAPAFPGQRRTTVDGCQRVDDEPVADLVERLGDQTMRRVTGIGLSAIRDEGLDAMLAQPGGHVIACDAVDDADLARIVAAGRACARRVVWAGSAGLAAALFDGLPTSAEPRSAVEVAPGRAVLVVVGSLAAVSLTQLEVLLARPGCVGIPVEPAELAVAPDTVAVRAGKEASDALTRGEDAVIHLTPGAPRLAQGQAACITAGLALAARLSIDHATGLLLTGGQTARAVCDRSGLATIDLVAEVEPGVPLGYFGTPARAIVTKAGAFGHADTLTVALDAIKEQSACVIRS